MARFGLFAIAVLGFAVPAVAQQRTDAGEAARAGDAQRIQATQFPAPSLSVAQSGAVIVRVSADADGTCWATRRGKRVSAERAGTLGPMWHGRLISVAASQDVPAVCVNNVAAALRASGYRKLSSSGIVG